MHLEEEKNFATAGVRPQFAGLEAGRLGNYVRNLEVSTCIAASNGMICER